MSEHREELREAIRSFLLPVSSDNEDKVVDEVSAALSVLNVAQSDQATWMKLALNNWRETGVLSREIKQIITVALTNGDDKFGALLSTVYLDLHKHLVEKLNLSEEEARNILSHAGLIATLAETEKMSSAQITSVLSSRYVKVTYDWKHVSKILSALKLEPKLDQALVQQIIDRDEKLEQSSFADLDAETAVYMVSDVANRHGFQDGLAVYLLELLNPGDTPAGPYLQMLFYQCIIAEFYDHPLAVPYEFAPRGGLATNIFDRFPPSLEVANNPFLNNAKAVSRMDMSWAHSRKEGNIAAAKALARILIGLENMSFSARRELSAWIRRWILRIIRIALPKTHTITETIDLGQMTNVLDAVSRSQTNTTGIIEQRIVDFVSYHLPANLGWRHRGLGDAVNASNASRKKLGDCDYQDVMTKVAIAYEAHAGTLSNVYVDDHVRTLHKVLQLRSIEWSGVSEPTDWKVEVIFIAHDITAVTPRTETIEGIEVSFSFLTYSQFIQQLKLAEGYTTAFVDLVIKPINENRTPNAVRERFTSLLSV